MVELKIRDWANENEPSDNMIYKKAYWSWIGYIENEVLPRFFNSLIKDLDYEDAVSVMNNHHNIIGTHMSKSIKLPVIELKLKSCTIVFRYNFYDTELTVISNKDIDLSGLEDMFRSDDSIQFYHQGIPNNYIIDTKYTEDKKRFTANIVGYSEFYTIMVAVRNSILKSIFNSHNGG